jgi:fumarate reductase flavoprotein subunit
MAAAGTRRQRERGIEDSVDEHLADLDRIGGGLADPDILQRSVELAPIAIDWLDELGFAFDDPCPIIYHGYEPYGKPRVYWGRNLARSAIEAMEPLWDSEVARGTITPLYGHTLVDLIVEHGAISGVRVHDRPGVEREINASAVVLASGGYGANPDLYAEFTPNAPRLISAARAASTGDGLVIARRHGAAIRTSELRIATPGGIEQEPGSGLCDWWDGFANLDANDRPPREIHVNVHGRRFVAEDDPSPHRRHVALAEPPERSPRGVW